jgi:hypothetical protein
MPLGLGLCGNCCTTPTCGQICTTVQRNCTPNPALTGATVTVLRNGVTVGSCTTSGQVSSVTMTANGSGYSSLPTPNFSAGAGTGAAGTATMGAASVSIVTGGTGYAAGLLMTVQGGTRTTATTIFINSVSGGVVTAASIATAGVYSALPGNPVTVTGGGGSGATFNLTWNVVGTTITAGGANYPANFAVSYTGGGGSGAAGTAVTTVRCCVPITAAGTGYTSVSSASGYNSKTTTFGSLPCAGASTTSSTVLLDPTLANFHVTTTSHCQHHTTTNVDQTLAGVTITISGTASATGTTDATGAVDFSLPSGGNYTVVATKLGFNSNTNTVTGLSACGSGTTFTMTAATGYTCFADCPDPATNSLTFTDSAFGSTTLTWGTPPSQYGIAGTTWWGLLSGLSTPAAGGCPAASGVTIAYYVITDPNRTPVSIGRTCSTDPVNTACPGSGTFFNSAGATTLTVNSCPPSLLATYSQSVTDSSIYGTGTITGTLTE